ncbi:myrcene synthase [Trifolium pratense]|uniref:Myrcene synthase n=1 Tax=Trifolium pratense TaxID=57577 RepID=A0A2K3NAG2_TRIPR|nr:myrcene synthase [Trifolium pratense]
MTPLQTDDKTKSLDEVKRRSKEALLNSSDPIVTMKMIDSIQGLGIGHHLKDEINVQLGRICDWDASKDLFATSLQFRLLRHNGWSTCSDVFSKFLDKSGNFKESLTRDIKGMLSLYEASYLGTKDEEVLKKAMEFSKARLNDLRPYLSPEVSRNIGQALSLPKHLRMARWDLDAIEQLPEYMKICYMALYNTTNEIAYRIQKEHGLTAVSYLKRTWMDMFDAYLEEAKWFNSRYVPSFKAYLDNGAISVGSCMAMMHATFLIGDIKEPISMLKSYPRLFICSGEILRLWDDLGTSTEEKERGDNASSIDCLMGENNILDENEGRKHIRLLIRNLWQELNGLAMTKTIPLSIVNASLNMARTAQVIYQHGDDKSTFTVDDSVQKLIFTS